MNPNNSAYQSSRGSSSASANNRSNQMNPNNSAYWSSRGSSNNYRSNLNNPNNRLYKKDYNNRVSQTKAQNAYVTKRNQAINLYQAKKYEESLGIFADKAYHNDAIALNHIGVMLQNGQGVEKSLDRAFKFYTKAATLNNKYAQHNLAMMYKTGNGVGKDLKSAVNWMTKASEQNHLESIKVLATMYYSGTEVTKDLGKAYNLYLKASNQGDLQSKINVAVMILKGEHVKKDIKLGVRWIESAAQGGLFGAQLALARMYCGEEGKLLVLKDLNTCAKWVKLAFNNKENPQSEDASKLWDKHELWKYD